MTPVGRSPATILALTLVAAALGGAMLGAQITATARPGAVPPWNKGIKAIDPESYYSAMGCGKRGGDDPACVFWDTGLCKNADFELAFYTPYKMVAYQVWNAMRRKQPVPTPSYPEAQRTRVTIGVTPVRGSKNVFSELVLKRGGKAVAPVAKANEPGGGKFTYDYASFAPTAALIIEILGKAKTITCRVPPDVLASFR
jgi:hypothetical protein